MDNYQCYLQHRPFMRDGDVLEWSSPTVIGKMIRMGTGKDVNHTGAVINMVRYDRVLTAEAVGRGFKLSRISQAIQHHDHLFWLRLRPEYDHLRTDVAKTLLDLVDVRYDFGSVFKSAFGRVSSEVGRVFCSEAVEYALVKTGIIKPQGYAAWPGDFENFGCFFPRIKIY